MPEIIVTELGMERPLKLGKGVKVFSVTALPRKKIAVALIGNGRLNVTSQNNSIEVVCDVSNSTGSTQGSK